MFHGPSSFTVLGDTDTIGLWTWTESHHQLSWLSRWWIIGLCCQFCVSQVLQKCLSQSLLKFFLKFPGGPVVRIQHFHCHVLDLIPGQETRSYEPCSTLPAPFFSFLHTHPHTHTHTYTHIYIHPIGSFFLENPDNAKSSCKAICSLPGREGGFMEAWKYWIRVQGEDVAHPSRSDGQSWASWGALWASDSESSMGCKIQYQCLALWWVW